MKKFLILSAFAFIAFGLNAQTDKAPRAEKATTETVEKKQESAQQGKSAAATSQRSAAVGQIRGNAEPSTPGTLVTDKKGGEKGGESCGKSSNQPASGCCSKGGSTAAAGKSGGCCSGASGASCGKGATKPEKKQ
jgi:hypothetical protein